MKVYKSKDKYIVYLPREVVEQLQLHEKDDVFFFKLNSGAFLFAKQGDVAKLIAGAVPQASATSTQASGGLSDNEIQVLKKLDTFRFPERTQANVGKLLNDSEKAVLEDLIKKKAVTLFKGQKGSVYSISNAIYMKFLMRKKEAIAKIESERKLKKTAANIEDANVKKLEDAGYIVLQTEAEAGNVSKELEESIHSGLVLGTRAFNKKFYIVLKSFFERNCGKIVKELKSGPTSITDLSKKTNIEDGAVRAILYLMAEQGDVSERRNDVFSLA